MTSLGNKQTLAENLTYYVKRSGKMQKELAAVVGVATSTFNDWMKGKRYPRIDKIEMLADYFGIMKSDLIEKKSMETSPRALAELHFEMVTDEDLSDLFVDFRKLNKRDRQTIKELAHRLAETEA